MFASPILKIWLGEKFNMQIAVALKILLIGWSINLLTVPDYFMFIGIGKVKYSVSEAWIRSILNVVVITIMVLMNIKFGLSKVAVVNSISLIAGATFLKYSYFKFKK